MSFSAEMPKYQSHKKVWALKIHDVSVTISDGGAIITPVDERYAPFKVEREYCEKHKPADGGYYVVYEDGYKSFSPANAFEGGYTLV